MEMFSYLFVVLTQKLSMKNMFINNCKMLPAFSRCQIQVPACACLANKENWQIFVYLFLTCVIVTVS